MAAERLPCQVRSRMETEPIGTVTPAHLLAALQIIETTTTIIYMFLLLFTQRCYTHRHRRRRHN